MIYLLISVLFRKDRCSTLGTAEKPLCESDAFPRKRDVSVKIFAMELEV